MQVNILKKRGGKNADELTNNIMAKIFLDELATDFSFRGKQKKRPFLELTICSCIIGKYSILFHFLKRLPVILFVLYLKNLFIFNIIIAFFRSCNYRRGKYKRELSPKTNGKMVGKCSSPLIEKKVSFIGILFS